MSSMTSKLAVAFFAAALGPCILASAAPAQYATFSPASGTLRIPVVMVASDPYAVEMVFNGACFDITGLTVATPPDSLEDDIFGGPNVSEDEESEDDFATYSGASGILLIPKVVTYPYAWRVEMQVNGACFEVTAVAEVPLLPDDHGCVYPVGHPTYCFACGPCNEGEGACNRNSQCAEGLVCDLYVTQTCIAPVPGE